MTIGHCWAPILFPDSHRTDWEGGAIYSAGGDILTNEIKDKKL